MSKLAEFILAARDVVVNESFAQGNGLMSPMAMNRQGVCLIEAFSMAQASEPTLNPGSVELVKDHIARHIPDSFRLQDGDPSAHWKIIYWNDAEGRTQDEVIALLEEAAADA